MKDNDLKSSESIDSLKEIIVSNAIDFNEDAWEQIENLQGDAKEKVLKVFNVTNNRLFELESKVCSQYGVIS